MAERRDLTLRELLWRKMSLGLSGRILSALKPQLLFFFLGIIVQFLFLGLYALAPGLNWYPSRLGLPADWLDLRFYSLLKPFFVSADGSRELTTAFVYVLMLCALFVVYALAIHYAWKRGPGTRTSFYVVFGLSGLFMTSLLLQPYLSSQDIFSYAFYARITGLYGGNPYILTPRDFPFDPLFDAIFWKDQPSNYGPLWTYMSAAIAALTGTNTALTLIGIKLLVSLFALGGVPIVWQILNNMNPKARLAGTLLYAWNPLLILETAGAGHNDSVVAFFVLLALYCYSRNAKVTGLAALILSVLAKYITIVLLPIYLILWLRDCQTTRERIAAIGKSAVVIIVMFTVSYLPIYRGPATFQIALFGTNPTTYINSPLELVFREIRVLMGDSRDVAGLSLKYRVWWVKTNTMTDLRPSPEDSATVVVGLPPSTPLIVVEPQLGSWLHVYAPRLDKFGYIRESEATQAYALGFAAAHTANALAQASNHTANAWTANLILRAITWAAFLALMLRFLWFTKDYSSLVNSSLVILFASYWLIQTWFWPWYLVWTLPLAALLPNRRISMIMIAFSMTALTIHAKINTISLLYLDTLYEYRSLAIFGVPVLLVICYLAFSRLLQGRFSRTALSPLRRPASVLVAATAVSVVLVSALLGGSMLANRQLGTDVMAEDTTSAAISAYWADYYWTGIWYFDRHDYPEAIASLSRAIAARPDRTEAYRLRFVALLYLNRLDEAIEDISRIIDAEGESLDLLLARGSAYEQTQRFDLALQDFTRAAELDVANSRVYRYRAQVFHKLGLAREAVADQQRAIWLAPYSASLYRELAAMYATMGRYEESLGLYSTAIFLDKYDVESYVGHASVLRILGRAEETMPDLRQVLLLSNDEEWRIWARHSIATISSVEDH